MKHALRFHFLLGALIVWILAVGLIQWLHIVLRAVQVPILVESRWLRLFHLVNYIEQVVIKMSPRGSLLHLGKLRTWQATSYVSISGLLVKGQG